MNDNLPAYETMRNAYVNEGLSYRRIGARYDVIGSTVYLAMKRGARQRGEAWPLVPANTLRVAQARAKELQINTVDAALVVAELREFRKTSGITYPVIATKAGVHVGLIYNIVGPNPRRHRIKRTTARKLMKAIVALEQQQAQEAAA